MPVYTNNVSYVALHRVRNKQTGAYITTATITCQVTRAGSNIGNSFTLTGGTLGEYEGTIDQTLAALLTEDELHELHVELSAAGGIYQEWDAEFIPIQRRVWT